ncbi:Modification methylase DpnIIA [compost metagenome]
MNEIEAMDVDNEKIVVYDGEKFKSDTFLRWTGSKKWLLKRIDDFLPKTFNNYHEPFLGGGSVFFYIKKLKASSRKYFLSDINEDLINSYEQIQNNIDQLILKLKTFKNTSDYYYKIRSQKPRNQINRAAKFIYLNRTSFNGIYRVNSKGEYNVPFGKRPNVDIVTRELFMKVNQHLENTVLECISFTHILKNIEENDFVFLDPPYTVSHENNGFIEYNQKLFSWDDQILLRDLVKTLIDKKVNFLLTNASHESIKELYKDLPQITIETISRHCKVGGRTHTRKTYNELLIFNRGY